MKKVSILFISVLLISCNLNKSNESKIKIQVNVLEKLVAEKIQFKNGIFYKVSIDLINNSNASLNYRYNGYRDPFGEYYYDINGNLYAQIILDQGHLVPMQYMRNMLLIGEYGVKI